MPRKKSAQGDIPADPARFDEAVKKLRARVPMTRKEWDKLTEAEREKAFMVSEVASADMVAEVFAAIDKAVADGTDLATFKADIGGKLEEHWGGEKPGRLETIFRTNVLTAYNGGRHAVMSAPLVKELRPFWRFDGIDDDVQTEICFELMGTIARADDPWWEKHHPPLHYNCRSSPTPLSPEEAAEAGLDGPPPDVDPQAGFGTPPAEEGTDWEPETKEYPAEIRPELEKRLKKAGRGG